MRVVAGTAKGRRLKGPTADGTRPIIDRVKTALFDILSWRVEDTRFLDLFAGTGGVGIEALSRGAAAATFVEIDPAVLQIARENLDHTQLAEHAETVRSDAFAFLQSARAQGRWFDIIYVAPPQYRGLAARAVARLDEAPLTEAGGMVIAQVHPRERDELDRLPLRRLRRTDERQYGSTLLVFYEHASPPATTSSGVQARPQGETLVPRDK